MLTGDRNTSSKEGKLIAVAVAASAEIFAGALVVANAAGYAAKGSTATTLTYLGRADEHVDNSAGANGDVTINVRRGMAFKWKNDGTDPVDQTMIGKTCYIVDDETVAKTDGTGTRSAAGIVLEIDSDGVWVE